MSAVNWKAPPGFSVSGDLYSVATYPTQERILKNIEAWQEGGDGNTYYHKDDVPSSFLNLCNNIFLYLESEK